MGKIHKYVGLEGAKRIWKEIGRRFIDNTELDDIIKNMAFSLSGDSLTLEVKTHDGQSHKMSVDISAFKKDPLKIILDASSYDPNTLKPTIQDPNPNIIYLVPSGSNGNEYVEWMYDNSKQDNDGWEVIGGPSIDDSTIEDIVQG